MTSANSALEGLAEAADRAAARCEALAGEAFGMAGSVIPSKSEAPALIDEALRLLEAAQKARSYAARARQEQSR